MSPAFPPQEAIEAEQVRQPAQEHALDERRVHKDVRAWRPAADVPQHLPAAVVEFLHHRSGQGGVAAGQNQVGHGIDHLWRRVLEELEMVDRHLVLEAGRCFL
jgi:hypothetical protein